MRTKKRRDRIAASEGLGSGWFSLWILPFTVRVFKAVSILVGRFNPSQKMWKSARIILRGSNNQPIVHVQKPNLRFRSLMSTHCRYIFTYHLDFPGFEEESGKSLSQKYGTLVPHSITLPLFHHFASPLLELQALKSREEPKSKSVNCKLPGLGTERTVVMWSPFGLQNWQNYQPLNNGGCELWQFGEEFSKTHWSYITMWTMKKWICSSFVAEFSGEPTGQDIPKKQLQHLPGPDRSGLSPPPGWTYPLGRHRPAQIQLLGQPHLWKPKKKSIYLDIRSLSANAVTFYHFFVRFSLAVCLVPPSAPLKSQPA